MGNALHTVDVIAEDITRYRNGAPSCSHVRRAVTEKC